MRTAAERALDAAEALGDTPLIAASTAAVTAALAFVGGDPQAEIRCDEAAAQVDAMSDEELALRLDSLANLAAAELYLDRFADAGRHAERGLLLSRPRADRDSPFLIPVLGTVRQMLGASTRRCGSSTVRPRGGATVRQRQARRGTLNPPMLRCSWATSTPPARVAQASTSPPISTTASFPPTAAPTSVSSERARRAERAIAP